MFEGMDPHYSLAGNLPYPQTAWPGGPKTYLRETCFDSS